MCLLGGTLRRMRMKKMNITKNGPRTYAVPRRRRKAFKEVLKENREAQRKAPKIDFSMVKRLSERNEKK